MALTVEGGEPQFDDMLTGPHPYTPPVLPKDRPEKVYSFAERDEAYYEELKRLQRAIILHTPLQEETPMIDDVAGLLIKHRLLAPGEFSVSAMTKGRFLILLPDGADIESFIISAPAAIWELGISLQPWSPWEDGILNIPSFRVILDLVGIPALLYCEKEVSKALNGVGVLLGTIAQPNPNNIACYTAVVAMEDLARIPKHVQMVAGGIEYPVPVYARKVSSGRVYTIDDLPKQPAIYTAPQPKALVETTDPPQANEDIVPLSRQVLRDFCQGMDIQSLPAEIRSIVAGDIHGQSEDMHLSPATENHNTEPQPDQSRIVMQGSSVTSKQQTMAGFTSGIEVPGKAKRIPVPQKIHTPHQTQKLPLTLGATSVGAKRQIQGATVTIRNPAKAQTGASASVPVRAAPAARDKKKAVIEDKIEMPGTQRRQYRKGIQSRPQRPKRPAQETASSRGPQRKRVEAAGHSQTQAELNPEGYFQVAVQYAHAADLAGRCGFKPDQVVSILKRDNEARKEIKAHELIPNDPMEAEMVNLEIDSEEGFSDME